MQQGYDTAGPPFADDSVAHTHCLSGVVASYKFSYQSRNAPAKQAEKVAVGALTPCSVPAHGPNSMKQAGLWACQAVAAAGVANSEVQLQHWAQVACLRRVHSKHCHLATWQYTGSFLTHACFSFLHKRRCCFGLRLSALL